jgi:hypothetical protein
VRARASYRRGAENAEGRGERRKAFSRDHFSHRHPDESRDPGLVAPYWIPAFAGMTKIKSSVFLCGPLRSLHLCGESLSASFHKISQTRHSREGGNPAALLGVPKRHWISAFAGMTAQAIFLLPAGRCGTEHLVRARVDFPRNDTNNSNFTIRHWYFLCGPLRSLRLCGESLSTLLHIPAHATGGAG